MKGLSKKVVTGDSVLDTLINNKNSILISLVLVIVAASVFFLYNYRKSQINQSAYAAMTHFLELKKTLEKTENGSQVLLGKLDSFFSENKSSGLAPVFLLEKADLLISQGNDSEAITVMRDALKLMSNGLFKDLYHIKLCRLMLLSQDLEVSARGLAELEELSVKSDTDPAARKMSHYFLHKAFWHTKDFEKSVAFGKKFLSLEPEVSNRDYSYSKFAEDVSQNLDLITAE